MLTVFMYCLAVLLAYLIGSVSSAILIAARLNLSDPRSLGSGNPGATNMLRTGSKKAAALTLTGDALKGLLPLLPGHYLNLPLHIICLMAMAAVIGHMYPVYYRFKGGKGVATSVGVLLGIDSLLALIWITLWLSSALLTRYSSVSALIATGALPAAACFLHPAGPILFLTIGIAVLVTWRHRSNIKNLMAGKEDRIGTKK